MKRGKFFFLLIPAIFGVAFFASCTDEAQPPISEKRMAAIVMDLQAAENYSIGKFSETDSNFGKSVKNLDTLAFYYDAVFRHHKTNLEEFSRYMDWYITNSQKLEHVYLAVADTMQKFKLSDESKQVPIIANEPLAVPDPSNAPAFPGIAQDSTVQHQPLNRPARAVLLEDDMEKQDREDIKKKSKSLRESLEEVKQKNK